MKRYIALTAAILLGGAGCAIAQSGEAAQAARAAAALQEVQQRQAAEPSIAPATQPVEPQALQDEVIRLRGQINSLKKENGTLRSQVQQANNDRYDMQKKVDMAVQMAQQAYLMAQRPYSMPVYGGWTDSWAYPGGPVFTFPTPGVVSPTILPPIPGNAEDPRFTFRNFALPNPAPAAAPTRGAPQRR